MTWRLFGRGSVATLRNKKRLPEWRGRVQERDPTARVVRLVAVGTRFLWNLVRSGPLPWGATCATCFLGKNFSFNKFFRGKQVAQVAATTGHLENVFSLRKTTLFQHAARLAREARGNEARFRQCRFGKEQVVELATLNASSGDTLRAERLPSRLMGPRSPTKDPVLKIVRAILAPSLGLASPARALPTLPGSPGALASQLHCCKIGVGGRGDRV